jgi:hypothetical protein
MRAPLALLIVSTPNIVLAAGLIPGPQEAGYDSALATKAARYDRQFHTFNASPFGLSLDAFVPDPDDRAALVAFLGQDAVLDFATFTAQAGRPRTPDQVVSSRDEHGDLGMFAGVAAVGDAFRYITLRDRGAPAREVDAARQELLEAIASFHAYANVTGTVGPIARGVRLTGDPGDPVQPPAATCPDAWTRRDTWRADASGMFPRFEYVDNTSKDQMLGYVMAIGVFYDAIAGDPTIPLEVRGWLEADAAGLARSLMTATDIGASAPIDLVIKDAGGCPTRFHDLNPREVIRDGGPPIVVDAGNTNQNGFNALAALGIIRTLYHVSGAQDVRAYYYDELVTRRGYPGIITTGIARLRNMFINVCAAGSCATTNFSNVNMAFVAIWGLLRYETDPVLEQTYRTILQDELWAAPRPHVGMEIQQAFFNLIYAAFRAGGTDPAAVSSAIAQLGEFADPPYFDPLVENCDAQEIAARSCLAIDGVTTLTLDSVPARGGGVAAEDPVPKRIRPPSNFEWRSDPRVVNGGGSDRLNPGGDFRAAYWMGRYLSTGANGNTNLSPIARNRDGSGGPPPPLAPDAGVVLDASLDAGAPALDAGFSDAGVAIDASPADSGPSALDGASSNDGSSSPDASASLDAISDRDAGASLDARYSGDADIPDDFSDSGCGCSAISPSTRSPIALAFFLVLVLRRRVRR